ncbi:SDR family NAD(P)-dependent oxidoreductase [Marinobacteraceae bacterium S3BR75-40.1]
MMKTVVITGASSGIGESAAYLLAAKGYQVALIARRAEELQRVRARIREQGGECRLYPCDITDRDATRAVVDQLLADHGRIDALVNNAAHSIRRPIVKSLDRLHDYERTIHLNYLAPVDLTLKLLPHFLAQGSGHVVNISSLSTLVPIPLFSAYLASKSALESFTRSLNAELNSQGISGTVVHFPMVRTPMSGRTRIYQHMPMMDVDRAAGWILKALEKKPARIVGPLGRLGGAVMGLMPGAATRWSQPGFRLMDRVLEQRARKTDQ